MAKQRYINTKFWDDSYIIDRDPVEKLLFIYCLTNPLTNISGIYEISIKRIAFDTGIDKEMVLKIFQRFETDNKIKYVDGWLAIKNFIKHQSLNPKIKKGIQVELSNAPKKLSKWINDSLYIDYDSLSDPNSNSNSNSNSNVILAWDSCIETAKNGGREYNKLDSKTKEILKKIGGITRLRQSNEFQASKMKQEFIKNYR